MKWCDYVITSLHTNLYFSTVSTSHVASVWACSHLSSLHRLTNKTSDFMYEILFLLGQHWVNLESDSLWCNTCRQSAVVLLTMKHISFCSQSYSLCGLQITCLILGSVTLDPIHHLVFSFKSHCTCHVRALLTHSLSVSHPPSPVLTHPQAYMHKCTNCTLAPACLIAQGR